MNVKVENKGRKYYFHMTETEQKDLSLVIVSGQCLWFMNRNRTKFVFRFY